MGILLKHDRMLPVSMHLLYGIVRNLSGNLQLRDSGQLSNHNSIYDSCNIADPFLLFVLYDMIHNWLLNVNRLKQTRYLND